MTGNTFKGEICAYCNVAPSTTDDHVFAKKFFLEFRRDRLPQVPACNACNGAKAVLENDLMVILPFGGRHLDALDNLARLASARIAKNQRVARTLRRGQSRLWMRAGGLWVRGMSVPLDWRKLEELFTFVAKGLAWHHWKVRVGADAFVEAHVLRGPIGATLHHLHALTSKERVHVNIGAGTFVYEGAQAADNPLITSWRFTIYGGLVSDGSGIRSDIGAITGPCRVRDRAILKSTLLNSWRRGDRLHG